MDEARDNRHNRLGRGIKAIVMGEGTYFLEVVMPSYSNHQHRNDCDAFICKSRGWLYKPRHDFEAPDDTIYKLNIRHATLT